MKFLRFQVLPNNLANAIFPYTESMLQLSANKYIIYSAKLEDLFYNKIKKEANPVVRHIMVILVIFEMPEKWDEVVRKYLADLGKSSYYFGDTLSSLKNTQPYSISLHKNDI